ncbi:MAG: MdtA/MuxA family multidrug efflux RND transporter periplasmic adaptor subunit [Oryzomonas sp.]|jgi:multidrug efflux system membrane fusion protein
MTIQSQQEETSNEPSKVTPSTSRFRLWWLIVPLAVLLAVGVYLFQGAKAARSAKQAAAKNAQQSAPVTAQAARKADVGVYLTELGNVTPVATVTIHSRIDGQLMNVYFKEGQLVKSGDLLAMLDPRPFQAQLTQYEGQLIRDKEFLSNARLDLQRYQLLWKQDSIPKQQLDTQESLVRQYEGAVKADQGQVDSAKVNLIYCRITSPVSGRVGLRQIDPGNIVHAADTNGLVVVTQLQPMTVIFPVPEDNIPEVLGRLRAGTRLAVDAFDREQKQRLAGGMLQSIDNQIDTTTGTVKFKALFPNNDNALFPQQFVNVRLLVNTLRDSIVVPASAIQRGSQGAFVYLVKADKTVAVQPVTVGVTQEDDIAVTSGLNAGDMVVVEGAERLKAGSRVEVKEASRKQGQGGSKTPAAPGNPKGPGGQKGQGQQKAQ